jgi:mono/diheme cytochrome c family protein
MGSFSTLTTAQINLIVGALANIAPPVSVTPADLYANNCAGCHGPLATSAKGGKAANTIQAAINANTGGMGSLSATLTAQNITDIATALATVVPPTPVGGAALYATYCAGCHLALASSTKAGPTMTVGRISAGSAANPTMSSATTALTAQNIIDIAAVLAATPPVIPTDGPGLYGMYCAGCHNPLATSSKGGATAAKILATINSANRINPTNGAPVPNTMGTAPLKGLTATQLDLIATALLPPIPVQVCGSCHAVLPVAAGGQSAIATGTHTFHLTNTKVVSRFPAAAARCGVCHGAGYTSTTNVAATHNDGKIDIASTANASTAATPSNSPINWVAPVRNATTGVVTTKGTCTPACHGRKSW